jgi:hypothetical protein
VDEHQCDEAGTYPTLPSKLGSVSRNEGRPVLAVSPPGELVAVTCFENRDTRPGTTSGVIEANDRATGLPGARVSVLQSW